VNNGTRLTTPPQDDRNIVKRGAGARHRHGAVRGRRPAPWHCR
jgi:hypothetical protein